MNVALILSGGSGTRMEGDTPKQYIEVGGKPLIVYCLERLCSHPAIDAVQIVAAAEWREYISRHVLQIVKRIGVTEKFRGFSDPGENRQLSILHGLEDIRKFAEDEDYVFIHDAVRPFLSKELVTRCLEAVEDHDGALPVLPMKDTVYASTDGRRVSALLKREEIFAGQAPEAFVFGKYYEACRRLSREEILRINGSTEPAILAGMDIAMVPGEEGNFKITTREDMERLRSVLHISSVVD